MTDLIGIRNHDGIAVLQMQRAHAMNAMTGDLARAIVTGLADLEADLRRSQEAMADGRERAKVDAMLDLLHAFGEKSLG